MFILAAAALAQPIGGPSAAEIEWVRKNAVVLASVAPGSGFDDLQPLAAMIGDARIVGLGESTHGTREHFRMKHRLVEFLATEMGFTIFSIEASLPESFEVDSFVSRGEGDPAALIGGMHFWTWNTEEVLDMVLWMRGFNERERAAGSGKRIAFTGFDMQDPTVPRATVRAFVQRHDAGYAGELEKKIRDSMAGAPERSTFGVATGTFPVDAARGKKVKFSGWIRTEEMESGFAGLWWRVDGPDGTLALDNMRDRGVTGTSEWKELSLELPVDAAAVNINFGALHTGTGTAWFDGLRIELDGQDYQSPEHFDLGFESRTVVGFFSPPGSYVAALDGVTKHSGAQSLRLFRKPDAAGEEGVAGAEAALPAAISVWEHLRDGRARYEEAGVPAKEMEWTLLMARIIEQEARMRTTRSVGARDDAMAENVAWILDHNPGAKIVLWAHNGHMARGSWAMGRDLAAKFGKDYLPVGFATSSGRYTAVSGNGRGLTDHPLKQPPPASVERILEDAGLEVAALDLRRADAADPGSAWVKQPRGFRSIGALEMEQQFHPVMIGGQFDILIYTKETTAAVQLKTRHR